MRLLQKNKGCRSYMEISGIGKQDSYACQMLVNNRLNSIPECECRNIDNEKFLLYKIDGLSFITVRYGRTSPEIGEVMELMRNLGSALTELEDYMLCPDDLVIDIRYIFYDSKIGTHKFLYVPDSNGGFIKQVKGLLEDIMVIFDHDDREGTVKLYDFYSCILPDNFTPDMFKELIKKYTTGAIPIEKQTSEMIREERKAEPEIIRMSDSYSNNTDELDISTETKKKILIAGGAVVTLGIVAMVVLGMKGFILCLLMASVFTVYAFSSMKELEEEREIRDNIMKLSGNGIYKKEISIKGENTFSKNDRNLNKFEMNVDRKEVKDISSLVPFISEKQLPIILTDNEEIHIGRHPEHCEYCLSEPGISRIHAVIQKKGNKVRLKDEGSTNGTYVNNHRISGETELNYGDIVSFAGIEYYCV
jgi:FOG: FHA domain